MYSLDTSMFMDWHLRRGLRRPRAGHAHRGPEGQPHGVPSAKFSKRARSKKRVRDAGARATETLGDWIGRQPPRPRRRRSFITDSGRLSGALFSCCWTLSPLEIVVTQQGEYREMIQAGTMRLLKSRRRS